MHNFHLFCLLRAFSEIGWENEMQFKVSYFSRRSLLYCWIILWHSQAESSSFLRFRIFTAPRVHLTICSFCKIPAAKLTLGLPVPNMVARKSWVMGSDSESNLSWVIRNHRARRCLTSCSRLHAAICATCIP